MNRTLEEAFDCTGTDDQIYNSQTPVIMCLVFLGDEHYYL